MKIFRTADVNGKEISQYNSNMLMRKILMTDAPTHIAIIELGVDGIVGYHEAAVPQLLIVLDGEGKVRTGNESGINVKAGDIVFWDKGEEHETESSEGMTALVVESQGLEPFLKNNLVSLD